MSDLRVEYQGLRESVPEGKTGAEPTQRRPPRRVLRRVAKWVAMGLVAATLPFVVLIRGGVFAYRAWALGTWPSIALAVAATALLLTLYAWALARKLGAGRGMRRILVRGAVGITVAYAAYGLVYVASANVKSEEVRTEYVRLHPLLRIASSALILVDPGAVITDAGRTREDYAAMGLPLNEASLHFEQADGFVHALDLRTNGRPEWRNRTVELAFGLLGFRTLRHVGTADHLHVSLPLP